MELKQKKHLSKQCIHCIVQTGSKKILYFKFTCAYICANCKLLATALSPGLQNAIILSVHSAKSRDFLSLEWLQIFRSVL